MKIIHMNIRSLICHLDELRCFVTSTRPDILGLTETWLDSSVSDDEICIPGYHLFRQDRNRHGGGVACYIVDHLNSIIESSCTASSGLESLWISISSKKFPSKLSFGCLYRPPHSPVQSVLDLCSSIEDVITTSRYVIACGDFNIDLSNSDKPNSKTLLDFITSHSLLQPICEPTRFSRQSNSIIDIFLTSPDIPVSQSHTLDLVISDHLPILLEISWKLTKLPIKNIRRRSFKKLNVTEFNEDMSRLPWSILEVFDDVDDKLMAFESLLTDILDLHALLKSVRIKKNPAPWISR